MPATTDRITTVRDGNFFVNVPVAAGAIVPAGTVGTVSTGGLAGPSSNGTYNRVLGLVDVGADNTGGADSAKSVQIRRGLTATFENSQTNPVLVAHIGQGWREPIVPGTPVADKLSIANYRYAIGDQAKSADLEELAAQIGFEAGKVIHRDGKPLPEKKKKKEQADEDKE